MILNKQQVSYLAGLKDADVIGAFFSDDKEYLVLQLKGGMADTSAALRSGKQFQEVSRFHIGNTCCIIAQKIMADNEQETDLSTILSTRELQIATLVALGCPNKQVANKLHISEWTVATHLRRIFAKLGVDTRAAMTYRCASLIRGNGAPLVT